MGARGLAEDDALQLRVADAGDKLDVLEQVGEEVDDERVGVGRGVVERRTYGLSSWCNSTDSGGDESVITRRQP